MQKLQLKKEYQKYPEYKNSGVGYLDKIPKKWGVRRMKFCIGKMESGSRENIDKNLHENAVPSIGGEHIFNGKIKFKDNKYITQEYYNFLHKGKIKSGDILMVKDGATIGKIGIAQELKEKMAVNEHVYLIRSNKETEQKFLYYLLLSPEIQSLISLETRGSAQGGLNTTFTSNIFNTFPSKQDQQKIAEFLDEKVELIEKIVQKKKQLIDLLKEKRTAVINQAVNSDSADDMQRLKFSVETNPSKQVLKFFPDDYLVSFLPMEKVSSKGKISLEDERKLEMVKEGFTYFKNKDVIFAKITPCFENGKGALVDNLKNEIGFGSTEFIVLRANKDMDPKYVYYLISSHKFRKIGEVEMRGSAGQKRVPEAFARNYLFNKISHEKQVKIVKDLDNKTEASDAVVKKVVESINLLNEFKSSLISNVVTGKVKI